ncbi:MAG: MFS transporter [Congregibacter sp.]
MNSDSSHGLIRRILGAQPAIFFVCLVAWTLTNMDQSLFGYAIPGILAEFELPLGVAGNILAISFLTSSVLIVLSGVAADRWGRGAVLLFLLGASSVFVGLQGLASGILALTFFRAMGFGLSGGLSPITNAFVAEHAPARYRGIAMGLLQCGYPLGWLISSLLAAPLLEDSGWRSVCFIAFIVLPMLIPIAWILHRSGQLKQGSDAELAAKQAPTVSAGTASSRLRSLFSAKYRRNSLACMGMFLSFGGAYAGSVFFFPTFFTQESGYSAAEAALLVGKSNGIAVFGYMAAALVGEFLITRRNVYIIWCLGGAAGLLMLLWFSHSPTQDLIWFSVTAALFFGSQAVVAVFIAEIFPREIRATALAVCASAPLSLGFAIFPAIVPLVVAKLGWSLGLTVVVLPLLLCSAFMASLLPNRESGLPVDD